MAGKPGAGTMSSVSPSTVADSGPARREDPGDSPATNDDPTGQRLNAPAGSCANNACSGVNWGNTYGNKGTPIGTGIRTTSNSGDGCPPVPLVCGGSIVPGFSGSGWVPKATASPPPPPAPKPVVRKITNGDPASQLADCTGLEFWRGACPSERAAAGTTPQQVKQSFLGATAILTGAILGPLLEGIGAAASAGTAAEDSSALADASNSAFRAADNAGDWTVSAKHLFGAAGRWAKFAQGADPQAAVQDALRSPSATFLPNLSGGPGSFIVRTDLGYVIGSNGQTALRIVVSSDGRIITAFPVK